MDLKKSMSKSRVSFGLLANGVCHVISHGDNRNKINTILPLE